MDELSLGSVLANEIGIALSGNGLDDVQALSDQILPFLDHENASILLKGVIDPNGTLFVDPTQFANFIVDQNNVFPTHMTFQMVPQQVTPTPTSIPTKSTTNCTNFPQVIERTIRSSSQPETTSSSSQSEPPPKSLLTPIKPSILKAVNSSSPTKNSAAQVAPATLATSVVPTTSKKSQSGKNSVNGSLAAPQPSIGKGPFNCPTCGKTFLKLPQFRKHKAEHLDEKIFRCKICAMSFNFDVNLKLHMMVHEAETSGCLQCQICPAKFSRLASLKSHLRVHEKEDNLVCQECGDEFPTKARLDTHLDEHRTRLQNCLLHRCRLCSKNFTQAALLKDHMKEHADYKKELKGLSKRKRGKGKAESASETHIKRQRQREMNIEPKAAKKKTRACHLCEKSFEKPSQLSRHIRIHTGEKPFVCAQCGKSFNQKGTLESHIQATHDKKKPFVCHLCSCNFSQRGNLKAHVLKVHVQTAGENEKVFRCFECSCVYRRLATLNNHIAKAHTIQPARDTEPNAEPGETYFPQSAALSAEQLQQQGNAPADSRFQPATKSVNPLVPTQSELNTSASMRRDFSNNKDTSLPRTGFEGDPNESISEVNLAHREQGKSGRCLVKVKKIGMIKWHLCRFCSKSFRKPSDLIRHIRVHTLERPFSCNICPKTFAVKSTLNTHLRTHLAVKELECRTCHKRFSMLSSLKAHERLHTGSKPFQCMQCGKLFRTSAQRRIHLKVHARNANGLSGKRKLLRIGEATHVELPDPLRITSNGLVPVPNRAVQALIRNGTHEGRVRPYKCHQCPSGFKKSSHLKQHIRAHTGERPYKCFQCLRSFVSSGVLKNHIKTHEGVRAFKCSVCSISFTTNGSLTRHMAIHTSARPYVCPYCHKTFKTSVSCRKHIKTHRNEIVAFHSVNDGSSNNPAPTEPPQEQQQNINQATEIMDTNFQQLANQTFPPDFGQGLPQSQYSDGYAGLLPGMNDTGPAPNMTLMPNGTIVSRVQETCLNSARNSLAAMMDSMANASANPGIQCMGSQPTSNCLSNQQNQPTLQLQGITNANGTVTLQYTVTPQIGQNNDHQHIQLDAASQALFDQTLFSLPDLHTPLTFLPDSQDSSLNNINPEPISSQPLPFTFQDAPLTVSVSNQPEVESLTTPVENTEISPNVGQCMQTTNVTEPPIPVDNAAATIRKLSTARDTEEVRKIRETSRPISERIYNELRAQEKVSRAAAQPNSGRLEKLNECQLCSRAFKKRSDLSRHIRIHTGEKPFRCQICGKVFRVKSTREAHMRTHVGGKSVSCHMCNNLFATKSSLRVHMRLHTGAKPYQCPHCDRTFRTSGHRKAHVQSHLKQQRELDALASAVEAQNQNDPNLNDLHHQFSMNTNNHLLVLPPVETIKDKSAASARAVAAAQQELDNISACLAAAASAAENGNVAGNNAMDPLQMLGSVQLTMEGPTIQITGLDLNSLQMDENFLQNVANVIFIPPSGGSNGTDLGNGTQNLVVLPDITAELLAGITGKYDGSLSHLDSSSGLNGFNMNASNISVSGDVNVNQYVMNSSELVIATNVTNNVNRNRRIPANKTCRQCGKTFAKPSLLARHMRVHTGERPYVCLHCPRTFSQKSSLDSHLYVHSNDRPYSCPLCAFKTVQRAALRKHFSRAHPNDWVQFPVSDHLEKEPSQQQATKANL